jgi:hypothetical protein
MLRISMNDGKFFRGGWRAVPLPAFKTGLAYSRDGSPPWK